ncbi:MAG: hypothetical protein MI924_17675 [Chloroflexales bacterium]|nr:hypothetical protein [Chloroflexales bacterium]
MHVHMRQIVVASFALIVGFFLSVFAAASASDEHPFSVQKFSSTPTQILWKFERECENPDQHTVGKTIFRSSASGQEVHGQFGTTEDTSGYPAESGFVKYTNINIPQVDNLYLTVRYSKSSSASVPIEVHINDEPRGVFTPTNTGNWNVFTSTNAIHLGNIDNGVYTMTFYTEGQQFGVADLDKFSLTGDLPVSLSPFQVFLPLIFKDFFNNWATNDSYSTTCAEEDNVNIPAFARQINNFEVTATHPTYDIGIDSCEADFSGCATAAFQALDTCTQLFDDGTNIVYGCTVTGWWRPYSMNIVVGGNSGSYHYLTLHRKIQDENSWPQFLVLYEDGNMRLKPHPPTGRSDTCFGSSVIVGPAPPSQRPYIDIQEVQVSLPELTLDLTYRSGGTAHIDLSVNRSQAVASVDVNYPMSTAIPFATFRSMYVADGNADVDHIQTLSKDSPILDGWNTEPGPWWFFYRTVRSIHNTSAPDIRIEVLN